MSSLILITQLSNNGSPLYKKLFLIRKARGKTGAQNLDKNAIRKLY